jgi:hypothetical protein
MAVTDASLNVYTDPALLDVAGAVESLPAFEASASSKTVQPLCVAD